MTAFEFFLELPEPYCSQAIENAAERSRRVGEKRLEVERNNIRDAINKSFAWSGTPQGYQYWKDLYDSFEEKQKPKKLKGFGTFDKRFVRWSQTA